MSSAIQTADAPVRMGWVRLLSVIAIGLSGFLLWGSWSGDALPGCGAESGCGAVMHSRWARVLGVPVSVPAIVVYLAVLWGTAMVRSQSSASQERRGWELLAGAAAALIGAALWFIALQLFVIEAICPFCMTAHGCGLLVGTLLLRRLPWRGGRLAPPAEGPAASPMLRPMAVLGLAGVALMAGGQILVQPPTYAVQAIQAPVAATGQAQTNRAQESGRSASSVPAPSTTNQAAAQTASVSTNTAVSKPAPRLLSLHGGAFQLDLTQVPLVGSPEAPYVIVQLFDYSCQHCRRMHPVLRDALQALSNQLAIVCLPMPLATNCNPLIKHVLPDHIYACAYAKSALALWHADRSKLPELDEWAFAPTNRLSPPAFANEAIRLVGTNAYKEALKSPWVQEQLALDIRIFETNWVYYRKSSLPQLLIGTNIVTGILRSTNDFYRLLGAQFPIRLPEGATNR